MFEAKIATELHIVCPFCDKATSRVDHLVVGQQFGPWYCEECGHAYQGERTETGALLEKLDKRKTPVFVLLQYAKDPSLRMIVQHFSYSEDPPSPDYLTKRLTYYFNEGTCPTNFLRNVTEVIAKDGDREYRDPHGVFEFVRIATAEDMGQEELSGAIN
jgi:ribosomal protein L37AE/L43A